MSKDHTEVPHVQPVSIPGVPASDTPRTEAAQDGIHSCGYHCERPACMKAQRKELMGELTALREQHERAVASWKRDEDLHFEEQKALRARLEEAEKEAARYRWLRDEMTEKQFRQLQRENAWAYLDAAIDSEMGGRDAA